MADLNEIKNLINPNKAADKNFYLDLLDAEKQKQYEDMHVRAILVMLRVLYINKLKTKISEAEKEIKNLTAQSDYGAEEYKKTINLKAEITAARKKIQTYKCFFNEPYFARMDLIDDKEGYNSYYIGKHGDEGLEVVDWRAPLAKKYYQKSLINFSINQYNYKLVLRRALRAQSGKILDFQNEYLSVKDYLSKEEIGGRDEEIIFDPFLKEILKSRKEKSGITDIIETIQEKQYQIITLPEREQFIVQGVAGSGKTMILLHRLSYLMYNNDSIKPRDVLVITPSDSFNAFIDELSAILELEKVKTSTLESYFISVLKNQGIDVYNKIDFNAKLPQEYLNYVYSEKFTNDIDKRLKKIYDGVIGMFTAEECNEVITSIVSTCKYQRSIYENIKNSSLRIRRCVLGEIKEKPNGGLYYTKQFRYLFNSVTETEEFLLIDFAACKNRGYGWFYKQLLSFYKSIRFIRRYGNNICLAAISDLTALYQTIEKEISDLKRYKIKVDGTEVLTYAERIERRSQTLKEVQSTIQSIKRVLDGFAVFCDFADVIKDNYYLVTIGKCENSVDVARFFYKEIVKNVKTRYGVSTKKMYKTDPFLITYLLMSLGYNLTPRYAFVFVDEAQDISPAEYSVLKKINSTACFNIFGDLKQNVTAFRGLNSWSNVGFPVYNLNLNYRNTNQIVECVSQKLSIDMQSIGFDGEDVEYIKPRNVTSYLSNKKGLRAVICSEARLEEFLRKSYNVVRLAGKLSKTQINLLTVYESKGLEFTAVAVADSDLTENEKYIAYTRALKQLAIIVD